MSKERKKEGVNESFLSEFLERKEKKVVVSMVRE